MTDYYLESGISGSVESRLTSWCPGAGHVNFTGWANALDLSTWNGGTQRVECAPSSNIKSIKVHVNKIHGCSNSACWSNVVDNTVKVELWTGVKFAGGPTGTKVGEALFVHLDDILVTDGTTYNRPGSGYLSIGWTPDTPSGTCSACYTGHHVHMQSDTAASLHSNMSCDASISCCGTQMYKWTV